VTPEDPVTGVHPVADLFPMMGADELKDLADDIAANGLVDKIVLDADGLILDGRNRYQACQIAGAEPGFRVYDGGDPVGLILAANVARRHMIKGQRAMVIARAMRVQDVQKLNTRQASSAYGISTGRLSEASVVIDHARDLADHVLSGAVSLDEAYAEAKRRKDVAEEAERLLAQLRDAAPDLVERVLEDRLTAQQAYKEWRRREAEAERLHRTRAETATDLLYQHVSAVAGLAGGRDIELARGFDPAIARFRPVTRQTLLDARAVIDNILAVFEERGLP
jgi:ParB-like chromosome segregation protein Spo0J